MPADPITPAFLVAGLDGELGAECPVCGEWITTPQIARGADDLGEDGPRIRTTLRTREPDTAAGAKRAERAAQHVHTDADLEPWRRHVAGHR